MALSSQSLPTGIPKIHMHWIGDFGSYEFGFLFLELISALVELYKIKFGLDSRDGHVCFPPLEYGKNFKS